MKKSELRQMIKEEIMNEDSKNMWLVKLQKDLKQNKYNLTKSGIYSGALKTHIEILLNILKNDYDM